jgi:hypothetical protein
MADVPTASVFYRKTATGVPEVQTDILKQILV